VEPTAVVERLWPGVEAVEPRKVVEVEIFGEWVGGEVAAEPLFDPAGERVRA
jgi:hypothetical protein